MSERTQRFSRRHFLLTVGAGSAATAAAVVATKTHSPAANPVQTDKRATRGYQASAHVDNYYRTTKV
jgi:hypothetical protein